jgi:hypothetical protein
MPLESVRALAAGPTTTTTRVPTTDHRRIRSGTRFNSCGNTAAAVSVTRINSTFDHVAYSRIESASVPLVARSIGHVNGVDRTSHTGMLTAA